MNLRRTIWRPFSACTSATAWCCSIDIANELHFSKPSVSVALKKLRESGYIEMDKEGFISLLPAGEEIAARIYERHKLLTRFFILPWGHAGGGGADALQD